jgi:tetratricopeptide (TPR) repeat protein
VAVDHTSDELGQRDRFALGLARDVAESVHQRHVGVVQNVRRHFDSLGQQQSTVRFGMWLFLVTEVLFFGGIMCAYTVYRTLDPEVFEWGHYFLDTKLGALNTSVLIFSSLTAALAVRPDMAGAHTMLGLALQSVDQMEEAIVAQREAVRLKPDFAGFHLNLGYALRRKWELDNQGSKVKSKFLSKLGITAGNGQLTEAVAAYAEAVRLKQDYGQALSGLMSTLKENGGPEEIRLKYQGSRGISLS